MNLCRFGPKWLFHIPPPTFPVLCCVSGLRSLPGAGAGQGDTRQEGTRDTFLLEMNAWSLPQHPDPIPARRRGPMAGDIEYPATLVPRC